MAYIGVTGATATYRFDAAPPYAAGDTLNVTCSGNTIDLFGRRSTTSKTATYRFVTGVLKVETPRYGLGPGKSGRVCVALLPNAAAATTVTLASSMFPVTPTTLTIPAGQSKATASATTTADGFSCPTTSTGSSAGTAGPVPSTPCTAQNGVTATAKLRRRDAHRLWRSQSFMLWHKLFMRCSGSICAVDLPALAFGIH